MYFSAMQQCLDKACYVVIITVIMLIDTVSRARYVKVNEDRPTLLAASKTLAFNDVDLQGSLCDCEGHLICKISYFRGLCGSNVNTTKHKRKQFSPSVAQGLN